MSSISLQIQQTGHSAQCELRCCLVCRHITEGWRTLWTSAWTLLKVSNAEFCCTSCFQTRPSTTSSTDSLAPCQQCIHVDCVKHYISQTMFSAYLLCPPHADCAEHSAHSLCLSAAHTRAKESQAHSGSDSRPSSRMRNADFRALWGESGPGPSQPGPSSSEEPIRWNRVRRRSSSRTVRPAVETAPDEDEVTIYPPAEEPRYQQAADCSRSASRNFFFGC